MVPTKCSFKKGFQRFSNPIKMISFKIKIEWETMRRRRNSWLKFKRAPKYSILLKFMCKLYGLILQSLLSFIHLHTSTIIKLFFIDLFKRLKISFYFLLFFLPSFYFIFFSFHFCQDSSKQPTFLCFLTNCRLFSQWIDLFYFIPYFLSWLFLIHVTYKITRFSATFFCVLWDEKQGWSFSSSFLCHILWLYYRNFTWNFNANSWK